MKTFEDLFININNSDYVIDDYNKAINKTKLEETIKSIPEINYNDDYMKEKLGRSWKAVCHHIYPIVSYLYYHKSKLLPIQLPTTTLSLYNNYIQSINNYLSNNIKVQAFKEIKTPNVLSGYFNYLRNLNVLFLVDDFTYYKTKSTYEGTDLPSCSYTYIIDKHNIYSLLSYINNLLDISYNPYHLLLSNHNIQSISIYLSNNIKVQNDVYMNNVVYELSRQKDDIPTIFRYFIKDGGKRAWAPICSEYPSIHKKMKLTGLSEEEIRNADKSIIWREDIFDEYFGKGQWNEWDRNASIYNITYSFNKKKYRPNSEKDWYSCFNGKDFENNDRTYFKLLCMTLYFSDARKLRTFIHNLLHYASKPKDYCPKNRKDKAAWRFALDKENQKRFCALMKLSGCKVEDGEDAWTKKAVTWYKETKERMQKLIGKWKKINNSIFLLEASVNLATMNDLIELGYKAVSVYDGFYTNCFDNELIEKLYKNNVEKYLVRR